MSHKEIEVTPEYLTRVRQLYPTAVGVGRISGSRHMVAAEVRRMEGRGEIISIRRFSREPRPGVLEIPFVRLRTTRQVLRGQRIRIGLVAGGGLLLAAGVGYLFWESRMIIFSVILGGPVLAFLLLSARHWGNGCSGIHCAGCGG